MGFIDNYNDLFSIIYNLKMLVAMIYQFGSFLLFSSIMNLFNILMATSIIIDWMPNWTINQWLIFFINLVPVLLIILFFNIFKVHITRGRSINLKHKQFIKGVVHINSKNIPLILNRYKHNSKGCGKLKLSSNRKLYYIVKKK